MSALMTVWIPLRPGICVFDLVAALKDPTLDRIVLDLNNRQSLQSTVVKSTGFTMQENEP